jgi:acetyl-CoA synthase
MSKIIASAAIRGAHKIVDQAEKKWKEAMGKWGANEPVGFPNTAYYLPIIYGITGTKIEKLGDMEAILKKCQALLPPLVKEEHHLPYLGPALLGRGNGRGHQVPGEPGLLHPGRGCYRQ